MDVLSEVPESARSGHNDPPESLPQKSIVALVMDNALDLKMTALVEREEEAAYDEEPRGEGPDIAARPFVVLDLFFCFTRFSLVVCAKSPAWSR
jgi:hypothetical protein